VTQKFYNDLYYSNQAVANAGGIEMQELNQLEVIFIKKLNWNLAVSENEYLSYKQLLENFLSQLPLSDTVIMMEKSNTKSNEAFYE